MRQNKNCIAYEFSPLTEDAVQHDNDDDQQINKEITEHDDTDIDLQISSNSDLDRIISVQQSDPFFKRICDYLLKDVIPIDSKMTRDMIYAAQYYDVDENGCLFHLTQQRTKNARILKPCLRQINALPQLRDDILFSIHDNLLHPGFNRTIENLPIRFYWNLATRTLLNTYKVAISAK